MGVRAVLNKTSTHDPLGVLHVMIFKGRLRSNGKPFTGLGIWKGRNLTCWSIKVGVKQSEVWVRDYERVGNLSCRSAKSPKRANRCVLWVRKSRQNILVLWFIHISKKVHLQHLKGMQISKPGVQKGNHLSIEGVRKGRLFCQKWCIKEQGVRHLGNSAIRCPSSLFVWETEKKNGLIT